MQIATDHMAYAEWIAERLVHSSLYENMLLVNYDSYEEPRVGTKYELRALAEGRKCYHFAWKRNDVAASDDFPVPQEYAMPHAVISTPPDLVDIARRFVPRHWSSEGTVIRLVDVYSSNRHDVLVIDVYLGEEPLDQRMLIALTKREAGDLLVHLHEIGYPRPTLGVHYAIHQVAEWVCSLYPGARVDRHNLQTIMRR